MPDAAARHHVKLMRHDKEGLEPELWTIQHHYPRLNLDTKAIKGVEDHTIDMIDTKANGIGDMINYDTSQCSRQDISPKQNVF